MYKLKTKRGAKTVSCYLRSGSDLVSATITVANAKVMIARGEECESDVDGYPLSITYDGYQWYFPGTEVKESE